MIGDVVAVSDSDGVGVVLRWDTCCGLMLTTASMKGCNNEANKKGSQGHGIDGESCLLSAQVKERQ